MLIEKVCFNWLRLAIRSKKSICVERIAFRQIENVFTEFKTHQQSKKPAFYYIELFFAFTLMFSYKTVAVLWQTV